MMDDAQLLQRYAEERSDDAFAELVRRHLNFVYSAALRQVNGDTHLAQDVTQVVFADLARKAAQVAARPVLAGWLFTSTRFAAAKTVRGERRRQLRDQEAQLMHEILNDPATKLDWERVRPVLDAVLAELGDADREAVLLRFFEGRDFASVGAKLNLTENTARMRVERALDKLHSLLARRGVTSTTGALATALAAQAVSAAPAGLAATVAGTALAGAAASTGAGTVMTFMTMTKLQIGIAGALAAAGATGLVVEGRANAALRAEIAGLNQPVNLDALRAENQRLTQTAREVQTLRADDAALGRLAEEAAALKGKLQIQNVGAGLAGKKTPDLAVQGEVFENTNVDRAPKAKFQALPVYPAELRASGVEGEAVVDFIVDSQGKAVNAHAVRSSRREFEAAAIDAVSKWQFDPGAKGGRPINTHMQVPIVFALQKAKGSEGSATAGEPRPVVPITWF